MTTFPLSRRGSSATTIGLSLGVMIGFSALAIDVGMMVTARGQLQNAYDAAALGAVGYLDNSTAGIVAARTAAINLAESHSVLGGAVVLPNDPANIEFGRLENGIFTPRATPDADPDGVNAVRVTGDSTATPAAFSRIFGLATLQVSSTSAAARPPGSPVSAVDCPMPIAVTRCLAETGSGGFSMGGTSSTAAWGLPNRNNTPASAVNSYLQSILNGTCDNNPANRATIGGTVSLTQGVQAGNGTEITDIISTGNSFWDPEYGDYPTDTTCFGDAGGNHGLSADARNAQRVFEGAVMVFDSCSGPYNNNREITSFAWATIYTFNDRNGNNRRICARLELDLPREVSGIGGGPEGNVLAPGQTVLF